MATCWRRSSRRSKARDDVCQHPGGITGACIGVRIQLADHTLCVVDRRERCLHLSGLLGTAEPCAALVGAPEQAARVFEMRTRFAEIDAVNRYARIEHRRARAEQL